MTAHEQYALCQQVHRFVLDLLLPYRDLLREELRTLMLNVTTIACAELLTDAIDPLSPPQQQAVMERFAERVALATHQCLWAHTLRRARPGGMA